MSGPRDLPLPAAGDTPGAGEKRDGERSSPVSPWVGQTAGCGGQPCASSPTVEQLQQAELMARAGHHPDVIEATTRVPRERIAQITSLLRTASPRRRR